MAMHEADIHFCTFLTLQIDKSTKRIHGKRKSKSIIAQSVFVFGLFCLFRGQLFPLYTTNSPCNPFLSAICPGGGSLWERDWRYAMLKTAHFIRKLLFRTNILKCRRRLWPHTLPQHGFIPREDDVSWPYPFKKNMVRIVCTGKNMRSLPHSFLCVRT